MPGALPVHPASAAALAARLGGSPCRRLLGLSHEACPEHILTDRVLCLGLTVVVVSRPPLHTRGFQRGQPHWNSCWLVVAENAGSCLALFASLCCSAGAAGGCAKHLTPDTDTTSCNVFSHVSCVARQAASAVPTCACGDAVAGQSSALACLSLQQPGLKVQRSAGVSIIIPPAKHGGDNRAASLLLPRIFLRGRVTACGDEAVQAACLACSAWAKILVLQAAHSHSGRARQEHHHLTNALGSSLTKRLQAAAMHQATQLHCMPSLVDAARCGSSEAGR